MSFASLKTLSCHRLCAEFGQEVDLVLNFVGQITIDNGINVDVIVI